jgi:hypothetical protein
MTTSLKRFLVFLLIVLIQFLFISPQMALAATAPDLGVASGYSVFGNAGITEVSGSHLWGDVGDNGVGHLSLIASQVGGTLYSIAQPTVVSAITSAYGDLAGQGATAALGLAGNNTVTPGVYTVGATTLDGTLTLDGAGVYIFRSSSSITVNGSGTMSLINGATACNVYWQIPTSMTISNAAHMEGTIIASTGLISFVSGTSLVGRAWAYEQVTMDNNQITEPVCAVAPVDICANIEGVQTSVPEGQHLDASGLNCVNFSQAGPPSQSGGSTTATTTTSTGQVLGATTLASTGSFNSNVGLVIMMVGSVITIISLYVFKKRFI